MTTPTDITNSEYNYRYEEIVRELETPDKNFVLHWRNTFDTHAQFTSPELVKLKKEREKLLVELAACETDAAKTISKKILALTGKIDELRNNIKQNIK